MRWGVQLRVNAREKKATSRIRGGKTEKSNKRKGGRIDGKKGEISS